MNDENVYLVNSPYYSNGLSEIFCSIEECKILKRLYTVSSSGTESTAFVLEGVGKPIKAKFCFSNYADALICAQKKIQAYKEAYNAAPEGTPLKGFKPKLDIEISKSFVGKDKTPKRFKKGLRDQNQEEQSTE